MKISENKRTALALPLLLAAASIFAGGAGEESPAAESGDNGKLSVFVSILPQKFFAERVGGEAVDVQALVKPGQSPHSYEPTPSQIIALGEAALFFTIGVDFEEGFIPEIRSAMPDLPIVDSARGISRRSMEEEDHDDHDDHGDEEHKGKDPHVWLSPENGIIIARNFRDAFIEAVPERREEFERNYDRLTAEIQSLDKELKELLAPLKGEKLLVFHPSFGYFADAYGLKQEAIETGGKEPSPKQLAEIIEEARQEEIRVIFVQPQFSRKSAQTIADAVDGAVVPIDPLARDWLSNLNTMADTIRRELGNE